MTWQQEELIYQAVSMCLIENGLQIDDNTLSQLMDLIASNQKGELDFYKTINNPKLKKKSIKACLQDFLEAHFNPIFPVLQAVPKEKKYFSMPNSPVGSKPSSRLGKPPA